MYTKPFLYLVLALCLACTLPGFAQPELVRQEKDPVAAAIRQLKDPDPQMRVRAVDTLMYARQDDRRIEPLFAALADTDVRVRAAAILAWSQAGLANDAKVALRERVLTSATAMITDPDAGVRAATARTLGTLQQPASFELLLALASDPDAHVREAVASTLWMYQSRAEAPWPALRERALTTLLSLLRDTEPAVSRATVSPLRQFGDPRVTEALLGQLTSPDAGMRALAVNALAKKEYTEQIAPLLKDPDSEVRAAAIEAYAATGLPCDIIATALIPLLQDPDPRVCWRVINGMYNANNFLRSDYQDAIIALLSDANAAKRRMAAQEISCRGYDKALEPLLKALADPDIDVRVAVIQALARYDDPRVLNAVLPLAKDADQTIAKAAYNALAQAKSDPRVLDFFLATQQAHRKDYQLYYGLSRQHDTKAVQLLLASLKDPDEEIRGHAANALRNMRYPGANDLLLAATGDQDAFVRRTAVESLTVVGKDSPELAIDSTARLRLLDPLLKLARDADATVSSAAVVALSYYDDPRVTQTLIELLLAGRSDVIRSLRGRLSGETSPQLLNVLTARLTDREFGDDASEVLRTLGEPGRRAVRALLPHTDLAIRVTAIRWLAKEKDPAAFDAILAAAQDAQPVRTQAVMALGEYGDPRALETLRAYTKDPDIELRRETAISLGLCGDASEHALLIEICMKPDRRSAASSRALQALVHLRDPVTVPGLLTLMQNDRYHQHEIISLLGTIRDPRAVEPLIALLQEDKDDTPKETIVQALGSIGDRRALQPLLKLLADEQTRYFALPAIGMLHDVDAVEPMLLALKGLLAQPAKTTQENDVASKRGALVSTLCDIGMPALEKLITLLRDPRPEVRAMAAFCLEEIPDARAVPALLTVLQDAQPQVRTQAARALATVRDTRALAPLQAQLASDKDPAARRAAAYALGRLGDPRAVETLAAAMKDANPTVRAEATVALALLGDLRAAQPLLAVVKNTTMPTEAMFVALTRVKDGFDITTLFPLLNDKRSEVQTFTVKALDVIKDPRTLEPLIKRAEETDGDYDYCFAVAGFDDPRAAEALLRMHKNDIYISGLFNVFGRLKDPRVGEYLLEELAKFDNEYDYSRIIYSLGTMKYAPAADPLLALLEKPIDGDNLEALAYTLGHLGDKRAVEPLLAALDTVKEPSTRSTIIYALALFQDARAVEPGCALLAMPTSDDLEYAAYGLGELGDARATPALLTALQYGDSDLQIYAAEALGRMKDPRAVEPLLGMLTKIAPRRFDPCAFADEYSPEDYTLRIRTIRALGEIGDARAVEPLIAALQHGSLADRLAVIEALGTLGDPRASGPITEVMEHLPLPTHATATAALKMLEER